MRIVLHIDSQTCFDRTPQAAAQLKGVICVIYPWNLLDDSLATSALPHAPVVPDAPAPGSRLSAARNAWQAWRATRTGVLVRVQTLPAPSAGALC